MNIDKAIITTAGPGQRSLPLQTIVDQSGAERSVLQLLLAEVVAAGIGEICLVVASGDEARYRAAAGEMGRQLHFAIQPEPLGYGHALACASEFCAGDPFLHLVSDHLYVSYATTGCAAQLVRLATEEQCAVSAVKATREGWLPYYGVLGGRPVAGRNGLYRAERVLEKPTPTVAEQHLLVPGLRAGHYLCLFGMHLLTGSVMTLLQMLLAEAEDPRAVTLTAALDLLAGQEKYLGYELAGARYDLGVKYGLLQAQLALGLRGAEREELLAMLVELLATRAAEGDA